MDVYSDKNSKSYSNISFRRNDEEFNLLNDKSIKNCNEEIYRDSSEIKNLSEDFEEEIHNQENFSLNKNYNYYPQKVIKNTRKMIHFNLMVHNVTPKEYQIKTVNDIIYNENKRIVSIFKDHLIFNDPAEFLRYYYEFAESADIITKWGIFFDENDLIPLTPNYSIFDWKKLFLKNIQKKFKLREKLIANLNDDKEEPNYNHNGEENLKDIKIQNNISNINENMTFTRLLDPNILETEISHNKTILLGNHKEVKMFNENQHNEIFDSSTNNDCTLILESYSMIKNSFYKINNRDFRYKTIENSSNNFSRNFNRDLTPIPILDEKSDFLNNNISYNISENHLSIPSSDKNVIGNHMFVESNKSINIDKNLYLPSEHNSNKQNENDFINNKFIFTSGNNLEFNKINSKDFETIKKALKDFTKFPINNHRSIEYNELFGDENKISESIALNPENDSCNDHMSISKYEEMDSFNNIKNNDKSNLLNLDKLEETKSLGDINLLTTKENALIKEDENKSNFMIKKNNLKDFLNDNNLNEKEIIKLEEANKKLEKTEIETFNKKEITSKAYQKNFYTLEHKMEEFSNDVKLFPGYNEKMNFNKKFNFEKENQNKILDSETNWDKNPFNNLYSKGITKKYENLQNKMQEEINLVGPKTENFLNNSNFNQSNIYIKTQTPKNNKDEINLQLQYRDPDVSLYDSKNIFHKRNLICNMNSAHSNQKHKKSKSNPNIKQCHTPKKLFNKKDKNRNCKSNNEIIINKKTNSKPKFDFKKRIDTGLIPLKDIKRKKDNKDSKNKSENLINQEPKMLISYVDFNRENQNLLSKIDAINDGNKNEKQIFENSKEIAKTNKKLQNSKQSNKLKNLNYIDESTLKRNYDSSNYEDKIMKFDSKDAASQNRHFSIFINKINDVINNQIDNDDDSKINGNNLKINDIINAHIPKSDFVENSLKRYISDEYNLNENKYFSFKQNYTKSQEPDQILAKYHSSSKEKKLDFKFEISSKQIDPIIYRSIETEYEMTRANLKEFSEIPLIHSQNKLIHSENFQKQINLNKRTNFSQSLKLKNNIHNEIKLKSQDFKNKNFYEKVEKSQNFHYDNLKSDCKINNEKRIKKLKNQTDNINSINEDVQNKPNFEFKNSDNKKSFEKHLNSSANKKSNRTSSFIDNTNNKANNNYNINNKLQDQIKSYLDENINYIKTKNTCSSKNYMTSKQAKIINHDSKHILSDSFLNNDLSQEYIKKFPSEKIFEDHDNKNNSINGKKSDINSISKNLYNNSLNKFIEKNYYMNSIKRNIKNSQLNNSSSNLQKNRYSDILKNKSEKSKTISNKKNMYEDNEKSISAFKNKNNEETFIINKNYDFSGIEKNLNYTLEMDISLPKNQISKNPISAKLDPKFNLNFQAFNNSGNNKNDYNSLCKLSNDRNKIMYLNCLSNRNKENLNNQLFNKIFDSNTNKIIEKNNNNLNNYFLQNHNSQSTRNNDKNNKYNQLNRNENKYIKIFVDNIKDKNKHMKKAPKTNSNKKDLIKVSSSNKNGFINKKANKLKAEQHNNIYNFKNNLKYTSLIKKFRSIESNHNSHRVNAGLIDGKINLTNLSKSKDKEFYYSQSIEIEKTDFISKKEIFSEQAPSKNNKSIIKKDNSNINNTKNPHFNYMQNPLYLEDSESTSNYKNECYNLINLSHDGNNNFNKNKIIRYSDIKNCIINDDKFENVENNHPKIENEKNFENQSKTYFGINYISPKDVNNHEYNYTFRNETNNYSDNQVADNIKQQINLNFHEDYVNSNEISNQIVKDKFSETINEHEIEDKQFKMINYYNENENNIDLRINQDISPLNFGDDYLKDNINSRFKSNKENLKILISPVSEKKNNIGIKKLNFKKIVDNKNSNLNKNPKLFKNAETRKIQTSLSKNHIINKDKFHKYYSNLDLLSKSKKIRDGNSINKDNKNFSIKSINSPMKNNFMNNLFVSSNKNQGMNNIGDFKNLLIKGEYTDYEKSLESFDRTFKLNNTKILGEMNNLNSTYYSNCNFNNSCLENKKNDNKKDFIQKRFSENQNFHNKKNKLNNNNNIKKNIKNISKCPKKFDILTLLNNTASSSMKTQKSIMNKINPNSFKVNETNLNLLASTRAQNNNKPFVNIVNNYYENQINEYDQIDNKVLYTENEIENMDDTNLNKNFKDFELSNNSRVFIKDFNNYKQKKENIDSDRIYQYNLENSANHELLNEKGNYKLNPENSNDMQKDFELKEDYRNQNFINEVSNHINFSESFNNNNVNNNGFSNRDCYMINSNKVLGLIKNTASKRKVPNNDLLNENFSYFNNDSYKISNSNMHKTQNQTLNKNHIYSQSHKNLPNNSNTSNSHTPINIFEKYSNISPLYKNIPKNKNENESLNTNRINLNNYNSNKIDNHNQLIENKDFDRKTINNNNDQHNKVNSIARKILPKNKFRKVYSSRTPNTNKNIQNLDFKNLFDNNAMLFDSATSKNISNTKKYLGNTSTNRALTNKNIQINNNIIINNGDSIPLTMNFNYDYNGKLFVENSDNNYSGNGIRDINFPLKNGHHKNENIHFKGIPLENEDENEYYNLNINQNKFNSAHVNFVGNHSARNSNFYSYRIKDKNANMHNNFGKI